MNLSKQTLKFKRRFNLMTKYQLRFMEAYHKETLGKAMAHAFKYHKYTQEEVSA